MQFIADLQLHSKYSRAVSLHMTIPFLWEWSRRKGIDLIATGDWTHPLWMSEIKQNLEEQGNGLLKLKTVKSKEYDPSFFLSGEVSCIYSQGGKGRRVHLLIFSPNIDTCEKINKELIKRGCNLSSDGRPIIGISSIEFADIALSIDETCMIVPAHAWTPWFGMYGSESGFDSIDECFGKFAPYIYAIETGLSSDPSMNWRIKELDNRSIVSFSDAHSGPKLGREVTVFELKDLSYLSIFNALKNVDPKNRIEYTIEFYPEEGKYHFSGHRACQVKQDPTQTQDLGTICPVCGKKMTIGVMHRVEQLAGRTEKSLNLFQKNIPETLIAGTYSNQFPDRAGFVKMVPLQEILAEALGAKSATQKVQNEYNKLTDEFKGEFNVLLRTPIVDIARVSGDRVGEGIEKVRTGDIAIDPGYDGVFGTVKLWKEKEEVGQKVKTQMNLF